jgi:hypothetical protein
MKPLDQADPQKRAGPHNVYLRMLLVATHLASIGLSIYALVEYFGPLQHLFAIGERNPQVESFHVQYPAEYCLYIPWLHPHKPVPLPYAVQEILHEDS